MQITPDVRLAACSADPAVTYRAAASGAVGGLRVVGGGADADEILGSDAWPERTVGETLRRDSPVQATTRVRVGTADPPMLAWVVLATGDATRDIAPTFGHGRHACPGHAVAAALACGVLAAFRETGWQAVPGQSIGYEPRPDLRIPHQVLLARS